MADNMKDIQKELGMDKIDWEGVLKSPLDNIKNVEELGEDDKTYIYIRAAITYLQNMNAIESFIKEMEGIVRNLIPETTENLKIILARLEDINPENIDDLSGDFINKTFTIEDKSARITYPEVGDVNELEFKRLIIKEIKMFDEQTVVALSTRDKLREKFQVDIPDNVKTLVTDIENLNKWVLEYHAKKLETSDATEEEKADFRKRLNIFEDAFKLEPIKKDVTYALNKLGKDGVIKSFAANKEKILGKAINLCARLKIEFPFMKYGNIEELMFDEEYANKHKGLFLYFIARFIKNKSDSLSEDDKLFLHALNYQLILIVTRKEKAKEAIDKLKVHVKELFDMVLPENK